MSIYDKTHTLDAMGRPRIDMVDMIKEFNIKFGLTYDGPPRCGSEDHELFEEFRLVFMQEEVNEYYLALSQEDVEGQLDALVDLVYVAIGTAILHGFDFNEAFRRVHAANMAKVRAEKASDSKRGSAYDVVKPEGWTAPDHSDLVSR